MFEISLTTDDREVIKGFLPFPFHFRCADDTSCTGSERKKIDRPLGEWISQSSEWFYLRWIPGLKAETIQV